MRSKPLDAHHSCLSSRIARLRATHSSCAAHHLRVVYHTESGAHMNASRMPAHTLSAGSSGIEDSGSKERCHRLKLAGAGKSKRFSSLCERHRHACSGCLSWRLSCHSSFTSCRTLCKHDSQQSCMTATRSKAPGSPGVEVQAPLRALDPIAHLLQDVLATRRILVLAGPLCALGECAICTSRKSSDSA